MSDETDALILDLVEWVAAQPRAYSDVMDAWRTSCPRLPVWEDAVVPIDDELSLQLVSDVVVGERVSEYNWHLYMII